MNRQKSIKVRLTESEYELLKKQANGQPMASYMRSVCLGNSQTPSKNTPNIHPQLLRQLAGIGNNTNQVARQINYRIASGGELNSTDVVELERYFGEILEQLIAIRQQYSQVGNEHVNPTLNTFRGG